MGAPTSQQWNRLFRVYAICTLFLWAKYFVTAMYAVDLDNHPEGTALFRCTRLLQA
jgi:hypothetical protein